MMNFFYRLKDLVWAFPFYSAATAILIGFGGILFLKIVERF